MARLLTAQSRLKLPKLVPTATMKWAFAGSPRMQIRATVSVTIIALLIPADDYGIFIISRWMLLLVRKLQSEDLLGVIKKSAWCLLAVKGFWIENLFLWFLTLPSNGHVNSLRPNLFENKKNSYDGINRQRPATAHESTKRSPVEFTSPFLHLYHLTWR